MLDYIRLATPIFSNYTETIFLGVIFLLVIYIILGQFRKTKKILSTIILFISSIFVITLLWIAFCAPHYFIDANDSLFRDGKVSDVGNAIGNLMDPFIAIAAAILTFMAFWVQYNANQKMVENDERLQTERQFYEMLKIHRESVQNLEWKILESPIEYDFLKMANGNYAKTRPYVIKKLDHISYKGLHVLHKYHNELMIAYETILWWYENKQLKQKNVLDFVKKHLNYIQNRNDKKAYIVANIENLNLIAQKNDELEKKYKMKIELIEDECANNLDLWIYDEKKIDITNIPVIKELFYKAYEIFFEGLYNVEIEKNLSRILLAVKKIVNKFDSKEYDSVICFLPDILKNRCKAQGRCNVFEGHRDVLNSYYRHLYHTVKNIVDSKVFGDIEKRKYLRILRSQMTSEEQALLLFNWYAGYGTEWESKNMKHHYFTNHNYSMIHNIEPKDINMIMSMQDWKYIFVDEFMKEKDWPDMFEHFARSAKLKGT